MKIDVSDGELADKYSILCLKMEKIQDQTRRAHVLFEKNLIHPHVMCIIKPWVLYYRLLHHVNQRIWEKTNEMKECNVSADPTTFARLASDIFAYNDRRFRMKRIFNMSSEVKEQKSYKSKTIFVSIPYGYPLLEKIDALISLVLEYDVIHVSGCEHAKVLSRFIPSCCLLQTNDMDGDTIPIVDLPTPEDEEVVRIIHDFLEKQMPL